MIRNQEEPTDMKISNFIFGKRFTVSQCCPKRHILIFFPRLNLGLVCLIFIGLLKLEIASMGRDH